MISELKIFLHGLIPICSEDRVSALRKAGLTHASHKWSTRQPQSMQRMCGPVFNHRELLLRPEGSHDGRPMRLERSTPGGVRPPRPSDDARTTCELFKEWCPTEALRRLHIAWLSSHAMAVQACQSASSLSCAICSNSAHVSSTLCKRSQALRACRVPCLRRTTLHPSSEPCNGGIPVLHENRWGSAYPVHAHDPVPDKDVRTGSLRGARILDTLRKANAHGRGEETSEAETTTRM